MEEREYEHSGEKLSSENAAKTSPRAMLDRKVVCGRKWYQACRRIQDVILSVLGLAVLWPLMLLVALIVVIDSPGACAFYVQERIGKNGKKFRFYKFRTMRPDAESELESLLPDNEMQGPVFKIKNDPRITRVGRFLRKSGMDELPQLINVIKGDMSIVGPRPALPREVEQYSEYDKQRMLVLPGLTGYWQIQPNRNSLSFEEWVELDLKYIQERSFWADWRVIFKTVIVIFNMDGQ